MKCCRSRRRKPASIEVLPSGEVQVALKPPSAWTLAGRARVAYLPFDLRPAVARFWRRFTPAALVLVEGDYWPLLLREARRHALPVAVINGRVGDRSFRRIRRKGESIEAADRMAFHDHFAGLANFRIQN